MLYKLADIEWWIQGIIGAFIGGAANCISNIIVAPETFNFDNGFKKLWESALISGVVGAALWLKTHPTPQPQIQNNNEIKPSNP